MAEQAVLDGHVVVPMDDVLAWARWFESADRVVAQTGIGEAKVSTVFLGNNHSWGDGPPQWFETMVFGGPLDGEQDRYETWEQAEVGHAAMCERIQKAKETP